MPWVRGTNGPKRDQVGAWLIKFAALMTAHKRFPATWTVQQQDDHTYLLTVTVDDTPALPAATTLDTPVS
jgi:hypothetical protein